MGNWVIENARSRRLTENYSITTFPNYSIFSLMRLHSQIRRNPRQGEQGYVLLILLLIVAMTIIAAGVIVPSITFDIKRDREEEMIHRGVQYSRAIRAYYKKFGRYPAKLEDLENTNQLRFLRKRYKDPLTGKDFKLLHYGEAKLSLNGIAGGTIAGATPVSAMATSGGLGQTSSFGGNSSFGNNSNSLFGQNSQSTGNPTTATNPSPAEARFVHGYDGIECPRLQRQYRRFRQRHLGIEYPVRRCSHRRRRQYQQGFDDSRIRSQEKI